MENAVLMAKLGMASDVINSLCENSLIGKEITDPQEMLNIAIILSDIAGDAAIASGNLIKEINSGYEYKVKIEELETKEKTA